jgi:phosphatidylglycerol:prolipoprotein diacylglycerol transferase
MDAALQFPAIDPYVFRIGGFGVRWYALAYIAGLLLGWALMRRMAARTSPWVSAEAVDDFLTWATLGVILGGRLGYVLFYKPLHYLHNPGEILQVWEGGMAFHGGLLGVVLAIILFARRRRIPVLHLGDLVCAVVPIGLFFGRLANFINGELWGRAADPAEVPWAMVFPGGGALPRHPSQIYEALLEGLILLAIVQTAWRMPALRARPGVVAGLFLAGYGLARFTVEFFRQPDAHLGYLYAGATMGQLLSLPMILVGAGLAAWAGRQPPRACDV